ncbi:MAG: hypothetical protein ACREJX_21225 [Polyangiaceae bacterium]
MITSCVAAALYFAAINDDVYAIASPPDFAGHTLLRKAESLVAFTILGLLTAWSVGRRRDLRALLVISLATFSALIEIGQRFTGTHESLRLSLFDVFCGAVGGLVASVIVRLIPASYDRASSNRRV